jgi:benzoyl-CoA reductase/2-hydroxyglutaryl-CoA dehydratase subunit BcrC/BadD/HgdB
MAEKEVKDYEGLINRASAIFGLLKHFPEDMSDEEAEGVLHVLPKDMASTIGAVLAPRIRKTSIAFLKGFQQWFDRALEAKAQGKKIILVPFNFPPEFVYCFENAYPLTSEVLTVCGVAALEGQGERYWDFAMGLGLPDYLCSSNTVELGSALTGADFEPDAVISAAPGSCDANSKIHEFVARYLGVPQFLLDKPVDDSPRGRKAYRTYFRHLVKEMEEFVGEELSEDRMREVLSKANQATQLYYDLWELRKIRPNPCPNIFTLFAYGVRYTMWGTDMALDILRSMIGTVKERLEKGLYPAEEEVARCFWIYTYYYWDWYGFFNRMEERGITVLGDLLGSFFFQPIDTTSKESMIDGLADTCWDYAMTRQVGAESMSAQWADDIAYWTSQLDADACIYCGHHSCKQTWSVFSLVRNEIMKRSKMPTLMLQGDSWIRRMTPMSVLDEQIDEFVGNVLKKKRTTPATEVG